MSIAKDFLKANPEPDYELGDVISDSRNGVNWLLVGIGRDVNNNPTYKLLKLRFPEELLPRRDSSGSAEVSHNFIPDVYHHELLECYTLLVDQPRFSKKVGHIDLNESDLDDLAGVPILHAIPRLREFYDGSEYFQ